MNYGTIKKIDFIRGFGYIEAKGQASILVKNTLEGNISNGSTNIVDFNDSHSIFFSSSICPDFFVQLEKGQAVKFKANYGERGLNAYEIDFDHTEEKDVGIENIEANNKQIHIIIELVIGLVFIGSFFVVANWGAVFPNGIF